MQENYIEIPLVGGKQKKIYKNGDTYEGFFVNGKREGKGVYIYQNGDKYEGEFKRGKKKEKENILIVMEMYMKVHGEKMKNVELALIIF